MVISDRHAYLGPGQEPTPRPDGPLLRPVRRLGPAMWPVATAVALLAPLGPALPRLLAASLGIGVEQARDHLGELVDAGVLHRGGADGGWRFPVPQVAVELAACLGPYERRWVAVTAVVAVWTGAARAEDPDYLTDRIAEAGALLDTGRARTELVQRATIRAADDPGRTKAWWLAAAELSSDRADEAMARWMYATSCYRTGDYATAVTTIESVLEDLGDVLPEEWVIDAGATLLGSMRSLGDIEGLRAVAHGRRELPGDVAARSSWRALALFMLGRWRDALELLDDTRWAWRGPGANSYLGDTISMMAELGAGRPATFETLLADRELWPKDNSARRQLAFVQGLVTLLLQLSEIDRARRLMASEGLTPEMLSLSDRASLAFLEGRTTEAKDLARRYRVGGLVVGHDAGLELTQQHHAFLLLARGDITRAREFLDEAIAAKSSLRHLLAAPVPSPTSPSGTSTRRWTGCRARSPTRRSAVSSSGPRRPTSRWRASPWLAATPTAPGAWAGRWNVCTGCWEPRGRSCTCCSCALSSTATGRPSRAVCGSPGSAGSPSNWRRSSACWASSISWGPTTCGSATTSSGSSARCCAAAGSAA